MKTTLTVLGSGNVDLWDITKTRGYRKPPSFLLHTPTTQILLDCSVCAPEALIARGILPHDLQGILITHFHIDHMGGLCQQLIGHTRTCMKEKKGHPLQVVGPPGLEQTILNLHGLYYATDMLIERKYKVTEVHGKKDEKPVVIGDFIIEPFRVEHIPRTICLGFCITHATTGKVVVYTGDMGPNQAGSVGEYIERADLLLIEAGGTEGDQTHLQTSEALQWGSRGKPKRLVLFHVPGSRIGSTTSTISTIEKKGGSRNYPAIMASDNCSYDL